MLIIAARRYVYHFIFRINIFVKFFVEHFLHASFSEYILQYSLKHFPYKNSWKKR